MISAMKSCPRSPGSTQRRASHARRAARHARCISRGTSSAREKLPDAAAEDPGEVEFFELKCRTRCSPGLLRGGLSALLMLCARGQVRAHSRAARGVRAWMPVCRRLGQLASNTGLACSFNVFLQRPKPGQRQQRGWPRRATPAGDARILACTLIARAADRGDYGVEEDEHGRGASCPLPGSSAIKAVHGPAV